MNEDKPEGIPTQSELPPFVKSWRQFYGLLVAWLVLLILLFYAFTRYFE